MAGTAGASCRAGFWGRGHHRAVRAWASDAAGHRTSRREWVRNGRCWPRPGRIRRDDVNLPAETKELQNRRAVRLDHSAWSVRDASILGDEDGYSSLRAIQAAA